MISIQNKAQLRHLTHGLNHFTTLGNGLAESADVIEARITHNNNMEDSQ